MKTNNTVAVEVTMCEQGYELQQLDCGHHTLLLNTLDIVEYIYKVGTSTLTLHMKEGGTEVCSDLVQTLETKKNTFVF